jgi:hypothetical protein
MDKVQKKTAFTDYNAPSSEPFRLHLQIINLLFCSFIQAAFTPFI